VKELKYALRGSWATKGGQREKSKQSLMHCIVWNTTRTPWCETL